MSKKGLEMSIRSNRARKKDARFSKKHNLGKPILEIINTPAASSKETNEKPLEKTEHNKPPTKEELLNEITEVKKQLTLAKNALKKRQKIFNNVSTQYGAKQKRRKKIDNINARRINYCENKVSELEKKVEHLETKLKNLVEKLVKEL